MASKLVLRLGEILVGMGSITPFQRDEILAAQRRGGRPFGLIAEQMFGVRPETVEEAWALQYAQMADRVDPRRLRPDPVAVALITPRQARQFHLLPVEVLPEAMGGEVTLCTFESNLARALRFVGWRVGRAASFVIADPEPLREAIERAYSGAGVQAA